ncbi:MAG: Rieske 2Fe-2S domain-containing protein [Micromonosporaceae bacterium]|nr:Rieske 2Fe-2S domain-containing protein [Micromonosporaceae bacterium]
MLRTEENQRLTSVGPGTPIGDLMRRYWLPACLSKELAAGGAVKPVELLGERLVAFRSPAGEVGIIDEACPHRGTSLLLARNEKCGLRCIYHGWQVDRTGRVVDVPTSRNPERIAQIVRHGAYPVVERGGLVWTCLSPDGGMPEPPMFKWLTLPTDHLEVVKARVDASWAQGIESLIDSAHATYLHADSVRATSGVKTGEWTERGLDRNSADGQPVLEVEDRPYGFRYAAVRRPMTDADRLRHVRTTLFIAPVFACVAAPAGRGMFQCFVPVDDRRATAYFVYFTTDGPMSDEHRTWFQRSWWGVEPGVDIDQETFRKARRPDNQWLQDRAAMQREETYSGISGVFNEDQSVVEGMGPIVDRSIEHLGPTDLAVVRFRRVMLANARDVAAGGPPLGWDGIPHERLDAAEGLVPHGERWQDLLPDGLDVEPATSGSR